MTNRLMHRVVDVASRAHLVKLPCCLCCMFRHRCLWCVCFIADVPDVIVIGVAVVLPFDTLLSPFVVVIVVLLFLL